MSVMQIIDPHIHRCRAISFNVLFSSSLPSFPGDFHGSARLLKSLELKCVEDDGGAPSDVGESSLSAIHHEPLQYPDLEDLTIDGRNYFNACQRDIHWTDMFPVLSALSISHFTPVANRSESFTSSQLLLSLVPFQNCLNSFSINDIHLDASPTYVLEGNDTLDTAYFRLDSIVVENMHNTNSVEQILDFFGGWSNLHIAHGPLHHAYNIEGNLSLKEIDGGEDLVTFLTECVSQKLVIDGCPGFGDEALDAMMSPESEAYWRMMPSCAPFLQDLSILNCPDFSISNLKKVVEMRRVQSIRMNPSGETLPPRICILRLSGRVPDVSPEDRDWFKGCLYEFSYDPIQ
jgi:hypothetical protein